MPNNVLYGNGNVWQEHFHTLGIGSCIFLRNKYVINIPVNYRTMIYFSCTHFFLVSQGIYRNYEGVLYISNQHFRQRKVTLFWTDKKPRADVFVDLIGPADKGLILINRKWPYCDL